VSRIAMTNEVSDIWQCINSVKLVTVIRKYQKYEGSTTLALDRNDIIAIFNSLEMHKFNEISQI